MQPHSLSYIWLEFTDWHKSYKGGMDRPTGREAHSLGAYNSFSLETNLKGKKKKAGFVSHMSFSSFKGSKVGSCSAFVG